MSVGHDFVKYGALIGKGKSALCIHGGGAYVWPVIQESTFLSLAPMTIDIPVEKMWPQQDNLRNVPGTFIVGISTEPAIMHHAAERLLGQSTQEIEELAREIIIGQLRSSVDSTTFEQIEQDREGLLEAVRANTEPELNKIGLYLIKV